MRARQLGFECCCQRGGGCGRKPDRYRGLMIRPAIIFVSGAAILFLAACGPDEDQKPSRPQAVVGPGANPGAAPAGQLDTGGPIAPPPPPPPPSPSSPAPNAGPATGGPAATPASIPYGQPVPGKPGFVVSPYSPASGYVDVRGFPPGTEVKDPYTQKVFLVP